MVCVGSGGTRNNNICNLYSPNVGIDIESKVIYFDLIGNLFHALPLLTGDIIVMGDFIASANDRYLDFVKKICNDENMCLLYVELLDASTYIYEHIGRGIKCWIGHVAVSSNLTSSVSD